MKKIITFLSVTLAALVLGGCNTNDIDLGDESEFGENVNNLDDVSMELNKETYKSEDDLFEITVINDSGEDISYGVEYLLEYQKDDTWYEVKTEDEPAFVLLLMTLPPNSEDTDEINMDFYEPLREGHYRVVRHIGEEPLTTEFDVKNK